MQFARRGGRHDAIGPERPAPGNQPAPSVPASHPAPKLPRYLRRASVSAGPLADDARLSQPGDPQELEADRMAERALSAAPAAAAGAPPAGAPPPAGAASPPAGADDSPGKTWRKAATRPAPTAAERGVPGAGRPLSDGERGYFEPRFGADLGQVRLHVGPQAAAAARSVRARAYTSGRDVVFGAGEFAPEAPEGRRLLAHELAHVLQHGAGERRLARRVDGDVRSMSISPAWAEALNDTELDEQLDILRREMPGLIAGSTERQTAEANQRVLRAEALRRHGGAGGVAPRCGGGGPYDFIGPEAAPDAAAPAPSRVSVSLPGVGGAPAVSETVEVFEPFDAAVPIVLYAIPIALTSLGGAEAASCESAPPAEGERSPGIVPGTFPFPGVPPVTPSSVSAGGRTLAVERVTDAYVIVSEYHHLAVGAGALTVLETAQGVRLIDAGVGADGRAELAAAMVDRVGRSLRGRPILEVMITHLHADHTNLLPALAERFPIGRLRVNALQFADPRFQDLLRDIAEAQTRGVRNRAEAEFDARRSAWEASEGSRVGDVAMREEAFRRARAQHVTEALRRLADTPTQVELLVPEGGRLVAAAAPLGSLRDLSTATSDPVVEGIRRAGVPGDIADTALVDPATGEHLAARRARAAVDPRAPIPDTLVDTTSTSYIIDLPAGNRLIVVPDVRTTDLTRPATDRSGASRANLEAELGRLGSPARFQVWNMTHHMQSGWVEGGQPNLVRASQLDGFVSLLHDIRQAQAAARPPGTAAPADMVVVSAQHEALGRSLVNPAMVWFLRACGFEVFLAASGRDVRLIEATTAAGTRVEGVAGLPAEGLRPADPLLSQSEAALRHLEAQIETQQGRRSRSARRGRTRAEYDALAADSRTREEALTRARDAVRSAREAYVRTVSEEIWRGAHESGRPAVAPDASRPMPATMASAEHALRNALRAPELGDFTAPEPGRVPVISDTALVLLRRSGEAPLDPAARRVMEANQRADILRQRLHAGERPAETRVELTAALNELRAAISEQLATSPEASRTVLAEELVHTQRELESLVRSEEGQVLFSREPGTGRLIENRVVYEPAVERTAADRVRTGAERAGRVLGAVMVIQTIREQHELEERARSGRTTVVEGVAGTTRNFQGLTIGLRMMSGIHVHPGEFVVMSALSFTQAVSADYASREEAAVAISRVAITEGINLFLMVLSQAMMRSGNPYVAAAGFAIMLLGGPIVSFLDYLGLFDAIERASAFLPSEVTAANQELRDLMTEYRAIVGAIELGQRSDAQLRAVGVSDPEALRRSAAMDINSNRASARAKESELLAAFGRAYGRARTEYAGLFELDTLRAQFLQLREQVHRGEEGGEEAAARVTRRFDEIDRQLGQATATMSEEQVREMPQWSHLDEGFDELESLLRAAEIDWEDVREKHVEVQQMLRNARYRVDPAAFGLRAAPLMAAAAPGRSTYDRLLATAEARLNRDELALIAESPRAALSASVGRPPATMTMPSRPPGAAPTPSADVTLSAVEDALRAYRALLARAPTHPDAALLHRESEAVAVTYRRFVAEHGDYASYLQRLQTVEASLLRLAERALGGSGGEPAGASAGTARDLALRVRAAVSERRDRDGLLFLDEIDPVAARVRATETRRLAPRLGEAAGTRPLTAEELAALSGGSLEERAAGITTVSNRLDQVQGLRIPTSEDETIGGVFRVVGTIESLPLLITEIPLTTIREDENVLVGRAGGSMEAVSPRGHFEMVRVVPLNAAAVDRLGGAGIRSLPDYSLRPVRLRDLAAPAVTAAAVPSPPVGSAPAAAVP
ncbi:MAG: hypothetical protein FAZ92_02552 [Accumulibacter sp.]|uniref:eCIS core domain-containing protein n=1 Tax=Accumulibacter sp. TaxID=2053492 RepID=UPI00121ED301|nr:DUF4157 domain-containing protein [Accumulibacter sp.]TLD45175.1 MAG: hypothetical protein FAZ92_02552 [Accumulibacter sp.]